MRKEGKQMKKFRTALINGYQKKEVDAYISTFVREAEAAKEELNGKLSEAQKTIETLKAALAKEQEEKSRLLEEQERLRRENIQTCRAMEQKAAEYEKNQAALAGLLIDTRIETENLLSAARKNADAMIERADDEARKTMDEAAKRAQAVTDDAQAEARKMMEAARAEVQAYKEEQEKEAARRQKEEDRRISAAKAHFEVYMGALGGLKKRLEESNKELSTLAARIPQKVEEMLPADPLGLFEESGEGLKMGSKAGVVEEET
ncbi:MAG: hypothetical protein HFE84_09425 [Lachnospiraceae bacterium]|nr:hypothetical protein [Lachnospiraceae bacterium]